MKDFRVRNSGLGRGLGQLMEQRPPAANGGADLPIPEAAPESRGVRRYLDAGAKPDTATVTVELKQALARKTSPLLIASLIGGDILLCVLAWWMVRSSTGAVGWFGWVLAGTAIVFGAWLSLLAVQAARGVNDGD